MALRQKHTFAEYLLLATTLIAITYRFVHIGLRKAIHEGIVGREAKASPPQKQTVAPQPSTPKKLHDKCRAPSPQTCRAPSPTINVAPPPPKQTTRTVTMPGKRGLVPKHPLKSDKAIRDNAGKAWKAEP